MIDYEDLEKKAGQAFAAKSFRFRFLVSIIVWIFFGIVDFYKLSLPAGVLRANIDLNMWTITICCITEMFLFVPYFWIVGRYPQKEKSINYMTVTVDILVMTGIIHSLGGINSNFFPMLYLLIIAYSSGLFTRKGCYLTGAISLIAYTVLFYSELFEIIPSVTIPETNLEPSHYMMRFVSVSLIMVLFTFISGQVAGILHERRRFVRMGIFLAGLSHELKNQLAVIVNETSHLKNRYDEGDFKVIDSQSDKLINMFNDILSFGGENNLSKMEADLRGVADGAINVAILAIPAHKKSGVNVVKDYAEDEILVQIDEKQIAGSLINLINNSLDAMSYSGTLTVTVRLQNAFWALVEVSDTGAGVVKENLEDIFEPFFSAKGEKRSGTGLGLAIAKRVVEAHDGAISVESEIGKGSTFTVKLPV